MVFLPPRNGPQIRSLRKVTGALLCATQDTLDSGIRQWVLRIHGPEREGELCLAVVRSVAPMLGGCPVPRCGNPFHESQEPRERMVPVGRAPGHLDVCGQRVCRQIGGQGSRSAAALRPLRTFWCVGSLARTLQRGVASVTLHMTEQKTNNSIQVSVTPEHFRVSEVWPGRCRGASPVSPCTWESRKPNKSIQVSLTAVLGSVHLWKSVSGCPRTRLLLGVELAL